MPEGDEKRRTYGQWWDTTEELVTTPLEAIRRVATEGLQAGGATPDDAAYVLDIFLDKALQGDHSRGLGRLPGMVRSARQGALDLHPEVQVLRETTSTALVAAGPKALTALVCRFGMDLAITKGRDHGIGWVGAQASGGILGAFVKQAVARGIVGVAMTQSFPSVAPLGSATPLLGNAPIAFGIPAGEHAPVILDMSVTESSASGVFQAARQGQQAPEGALLDERGDPTVDAREMWSPDWMEKGVTVARGSLRPLGGGHKGSAMVFIVGLLTYFLADASPPWDLALDLPQRGRDGTLLMALDPGAFAPADQVKGRVDRFIDRVKAAPLKIGVPEILYPGERSTQLQREGKEGGYVAIPASHYHGLAELAKELGMEGAI